MLAPVFSEIASDATAQAIQQVKEIPSRRARRLGVKRVGGRVVAWFRRGAEGSKALDPLALLAVLLSADHRVHRHLQVGAAQELPGEG
jgi:hypothetical protein